ncbi:MAG: spermidine synthase [Myxococcota bacterium]|nr:spermidine synthase [Myxococcota bacterium]
MRQRDARDFLITLDGRVLMRSAAHRSETALAELALARLAGRPAPRVLIGGLGMGLTLRAALDGLPARARVRVAELHAPVVAWCRGPLAELTAGAVDDPRVHVDVADVAQVIAEGGRFDAILLDLFVGPQRPDREDPLWGTAALARTRNALAPGGVFAVWGEAPDAGFEKRLRGADLGFERARPGRGGRRHVVYVAFRAPGTRGDRSRGREARRRS